MKIAVPFEDGQVFQHFGRSAQFKFYEAENGQLLRTEVIPTNGQGHGALAGFLVQHGADVVLCGGLGTGAQVALASSCSAAFPAPQMPPWPTIWPGSWSSTRTSTAPTTTTTRATAAAPTAGAGATDIPDTPSASATMSRQLMAQTVKLLQEKGLAESSVNLGRGRPGGAPCFCFALFSLVPQFFFRCPQTVSAGDHLGHPERKPRFFDPKYPTHS